MLGVHIEMLNDAKTRNSDRSDQLQDEIKTTNRVIAAPQQPSVKNFPHIPPVFVQLNKDIEQDESDEEGKEETDNMIGEGQ